MHSLAVRFGIVVRRRREASGMSQEALAAAAGLHRTCISMLERGVRMPSILVAWQIAGALGTSMGDLLGEVDVEIPPKAKHKSPTG